MNIYTIADLHLSFGVENKAMDVFGRRWENHQARLAEAWRETVGEDDLVVIPGDISWAMTSEEVLPDLKFIESLPGRKIIMKGNHDLWWGTKSKLEGLVKGNGIEGISFLYNEAIYIEENDVSICGTRGWNCPGSQDFTRQDEKIYRREVMRLERSLSEGRKMSGNLLAFMHFPPANDAETPTGFTEALERFGVRHCYYGHLHGYAQKDALIGRMAEDSVTEYSLVASDYLDFRPHTVMTAGGDE